MILFIALALILTISHPARAAPEASSLELELLEQRELLARQAAPLEQLRTPEPRAAQGLPQPPAADRGMVARSQDLRHFVPIHRDRPRVVRPIQQPVAERFLQRRFLAAEGTRQEPRNRIDHHQRGQLAARQNIIADRPLLVDLGLDEALVDPFVAAGHEDQTRPNAGLAGTL